MLEYMLDTNTVIFVLKNKPEFLRKRFNEQHGRLCISSVVLSELVYGAENSAKVDANLRTIEGFAARLDVLPFDDSAAHHTGRIRAHLRRNGAPIGPYDAMIAGHGRSMGLTVVTNNVREFERVPGLQVEDWTIGGR
ncbi:type II toxin-antitoxin system tRNA(fMet)-specific endonuclease VapC [Arthrobacter castelli]|uniref:type II toxin-antitoxin system tRNA(fMet)-specific endonuclease VapC n=1 Tax=Arthrobacter castelli TaxID=271431 RepID=UPI000479C93F|nr:tRNA(fMet)-specific endonuclease VapC [Arthrobacter castelli]